MTMREVPDPYPRRIVPIGSLQGFYARGNATMIPVLGSFANGYPYSWPPNAAVDSHAVPCR